MSDILLFRILRGLTEEFQRGKTDGDSCIGSAYFTRLN